ncbi:YsnF/AvaK domain-containing protein [Franconibacter helveticus]|uniref:YsnF/AvaK domain-containing protein n=1 Tax=Franconibacter helveticus TaxID=357240 RepID=UPI00290A51DD|nr:YsnF/AvaK domain-containing protein [Franconibacter helveticus]MDU6924699.1 YsnF/AvaK domain-containing protein [Franconibacter helveticus]
MAHEKIVTAFKQLQQAEVAKEKLIAEGIAEHNIDIISGERLRVEDKEIRHPSFWQRLFGDDVDDDYAEEYNQAIRTGGVLLTARVHKDEADRIEALLDEYSSDYAPSGSYGSYGAGKNADNAELDREFMGETDDVTGTGRSTGSLNSGLAGVGVAGAGVAGSTINDPSQKVPGTSDDTVPDADDITRDRTLTAQGGADYVGDDTLRDRDVTGRTGTGLVDDDDISNRGYTGTPGSAVSTAAGALTGDERDETLKLAEEQVDIGKRRVSDGVVRLRRYTVEEDVSEDISLFDQHADMFRRAVDEPAYLNDVDWSERTIEVEESHEVPTVNKTARVREEVGLRTEGNERVETVKDTVRRQEVEVDKSGTDRLTSDTDRDRLTDDDDPLLRK